MTQESPNDSKKTTLREAFVIVMSIIGMFVVAIGVLVLLWMMVIEGNCN